MRVVVQRVSQASVTVNHSVIGKIGKGVLILLGIEGDDSSEDTDWLVKKILSMRIFDDHQGKMNLSVRDVSGQILVISQFTLHASTKKGNRPSFIKAARPDHAIPLYEDFINKLRTSQVRIEAGEFGAYMDVALINSGPVTIIMDSKQRE